MNNKIKNSYSILFYVIFTIMIICVISAKSNFHWDEFLSYGLANSFDADSIGIDWGIAYTPDSIQRLFVNYMSTDKNAIFDYTNVWANQAGDVHPPLYYILLHTFSSFFPGEFSIWFAGIINVIFACATLFVLRKLTNIIFSSSSVFMTNLISLIFVLSAEVLSATSFLRMYIIAIFFVTLTSYFFVKMVGKQWDYKDYIFLFAVSVLSALTHYYCVVYLVFICIVYGIWLLAKKHWKGIIGFVITMSLSGIAAIAIFPAMLEHIFSGYRSVNSVDNFTNTSLSDYLSRLDYFFDVFNRRLFGNVLIYIILFLIIIGSVLLITKSRLRCDILKVFKENETELLKWCLLFIPTILYFFLVAKIAVIYSDRYMVPIYATSITCFMGILYYCFKKIFTDSIPNTLLCIFCAIMIVNGWKEADWPYLYTYTQNALDNAEKYCNVDCLIIYDSLHSAQTTCPELLMYNSVSFIDKYNYHWIADWNCTKNNELILILVGTDMDELPYIQDLLPNFSNYQKIGSLEYSTTYYLY